MDGQEIPVSNYLGEIIVSLGGSALLLLAVGFLVRSLIVHFLNKDVHAHKIVLEKNAEAEIARIRHEHELHAIEHKERFTRLHEKRAKVIAEVYTRLVKAYDASLSFVNLMDWVGEPSKTEKLKIAAKAIVSFYEFLDENRIYFPEEICNNIESFHNRLRLDVSKLKSCMDADGQIEDHEAWLKSFESISEDIPPLRKQLESEFRSLLGDGSDKQDVASSS